MATFFTSDIHFSDERIIKLCSRPFLSTQEMDEYIIEKWNRKVSKNDMVWVLGDIVSPELFNKELLNKLNGKIYLILGNHDYPVRDKIASETKIKICAENSIYQDGNIVMCHYPIMDWNDRDKGTVHLYGHVHNKEIIGMKEYFADKLAFNVCMDVNDFEPKTLEELIESAGKKEVLEKNRRAN
ncbi:MAG: metallophosphoesterase family protein [Clostridiales bacterium]|nr:metallophosphoesterase family protein [Clostridiales bacterium]